MRDFVLIPAMLDMPSNLSSLMSARQCGARPQLGEQFDTDSLSSGWSHVYSEAAATKFDIYVYFMFFSRLSQSGTYRPNHSNIFCLA